MLLCVQFDGTIGAEGLTFKLLERRLNNNFEPYKGKDGQIFRGQHLCMISMSRFVRQTFAHIHKHKGAPQSKISGSDLQDLLLISPFIFDNLCPHQVESWNETHDQFVADPSLQGAHGPCWKHRYYSVQHATARARELSRTKA